MFPKTGHNSKIFAIITKTFYVRPDPFSCIYFSFFLSLFQVDKLYDEKDEDYDPREKDEEVARMREHVMSEVICVHVCGAVRHIRT